MPAAPEAISVKKRLGKMEMSVATSQREKKKSSQYSVSTAWLALFAPCLFASLFCLFSFFSAFSVLFCSFQMNLAKLLLFFWLLVGSTSVCPLRLAVWLSLCSYPLNSFIRNQMKGEADLSELLQLLLLLLFDVSVSWIDLVSMCWNDEAAVQIRTNIRILLKFSSDWLLAS